MSGWPSLNIEYIFLRAYDVVAGGLAFGSGGISREVKLAIAYVSTAGMVLALVLLALVVYVRIRLEQVEHAGFHHKEEEEKRRHKAKEAIGGNPQWDAIAALASSSSESDWRRAILEADIMLGNMLFERGYPGETIADKLKNANPLQFTTLDLAWEAHRTRNAIAHIGEGYVVTERDARATIDLYRRVFEEFGVL